MRLLITGGGGLMGRKVAEVADLQGHEVFFGYHRECPEFGQAGHAGDYAPLPIAEMAARYR